MRYLRSPMLILVWSMLLPGFVALAQTVPPAQGPPDPSPQAAEELSILFGLRRALEQTGQEIIDDVNDGQDTGTLKWADNAKPILCGYECMGPPSMRSTKYRDLPNQRRVEIRARLSFFFDGPGPFNRTIHTNVEFHVYCEGWRSGNGRIKISTQVGHSWIDEDHSILEDIIDFVFLPANISRSIDAKVAKNLPTRSSVPTEDPGLPSCQSLGVFSNYPDGSFGLDKIIWDRGERMPTARFLAQRARVTFTRIRRLRVLQGLESTGDISFIIYANTQAKVRALEYPRLGKLQLEEGESIDLEGAIINLPISRGDQTLQIIVSDNFGGARWVSFDRSSQFGEGTHTIRTHRTVKRPRPSGGKPIAFDVQEFEITYQVDFPPLLYIKGIDVVQ